MTDWAVLPVENSLGGSIHAVYDLLLRYRLHIVGETSVAVNHCLLALPGTKKEDLTRVISHPQVRSHQHQVLLVGCVVGQAAVWSSAAAAAAGRVHAVQKSVNDTVQYDTVPYPPLTHLPPDSCVLQALAQVDNYLRAMNVVREAVDDTAGAAQMVATQQLQVRQC
jgi:prephenate dehydratase